ncbi:GDP-L-galactose [Carex littledalei]|uniref:GDP-L-galactose n=1 Tax=Carex littledalei TaxID=544730 RepID=A0A833QE70_9POAL|nr:GDP-L-galactose [Carex littledalei]
MLSNFFHSPGAKLPSYTCSKSNALNFSTEIEPCSPFLDALFKEWEERKTRGLFHHDITSCPNKILQGELGFITTLVEGRDQKKRPTEFKIDQVLQPFNKEKFNFTKVAQEEVIFLFEQGETSGTGYFECGRTNDGSYSPNAVLINVSVYCITWDSSLRKSLLSLTIAIAKIQSLAIGFA